VARIEAKACPTIGIIGLRVRRNLSSIAALLENI
jgi:hypothetical protein